MEKNRDEVERSGKARRGDRRGSFENVHGQAHVGRERTQGDGLDDGRLRVRHRRRGQTGQGTGGKPGQRPGAATGPRAKADPASRKGLSARP